MAMSLEEALHAALDDEYHARATYRAVLDALQTTARQPLVESSAG